MATRKRLLLICSHRFYDEHYYRNVREPRNSPRVTRAGRGRADAIQTQAHELRSPERGPHLTKRPFRYVVDLPRSRLQAHYWRFDFHSCSVFLNVNAHAHKKPSNAPLQPRAPASAELTASSRPLTADPSAGSVSFGDVAPLPRPVPARLSSPPRCAQALCHRCVSLGFSCPLTSQS